MNTESQNEVICNENQVSRLDALGRKLAAFCTENNLPHDSADELVHMDGLTDKQRQWLKSFCAEWDAAEVA